MKNQFIKCPYCNYEYHPAELFFPEDILGEPRNIIRDENNKIIYVDNETTTNTTRVVCDGCNKEFEVTCNVSFKVKPLDFDEKVSVPIYKEERLKLKKNND